MRKFQKISFEQFKKDISDDEQLYKEYEMPKRKTIGSAGYDFCILNECIIKPKQIVKIPTGIKVCMNKDEVLLLIVRSSMGFKYNMRLCNQVGVIDSDYYNCKENEGHIWIAIQNEGDGVIVLNRYDRVVQGIFTKYLLVDNDTVNSYRKGSIGSTDKEEE